jgi:hypothetical protein
MCIIEFTPPIPSRKPDYKREENILVDGCVADHLPILVLRQSDDLKRHALYILTTQWLYLPTYQIPDTKRSFLK